jgi:hypothetical protein
MEYGDEEVRVLTEIDEIEKQRQLRRSTTRGGERTDLLDQEGSRQRWDFSIEHPIYGKLVCSYYPEGAGDQLEGWFARQFTYEEKGKSSVQGIPMWSCTEAGMEYLQKHIQQGLHDALCGLVGEAGINGLFARNGREVMIPNLSQKRRVKELRDYYDTRMNKRLGARQGQRKDTVDFLVRAYRAYCDAADELKIPLTDPLPQISTARVTQEKLVEHMKRKRNDDEENKITVRGLTKQLVKHGLTYAELIKRCHYARWDAAPRGRRIRTK